MASGLQVTGDRLHLGARLHLFIKRAQFEQIDFGDATFHRGALASGSALGAGRTDVM